MNNTFSIKQAFAAANKAVQGNVVFLLMLSLILGVIAFGLEYLFTDIYPRPDEEAFLSTRNILNIATQCAWTIVVTFVASVVAFALHSNKQLRSLAEWKLSLFAIFALALILLYVGAMIGFVLLIVPGLIFAMTYGYAIYPILDTRMGIIASFKESARLTRGLRLKLLWVSLLMMLIMFAIMFAVGFLFALWARLMPFAVPDVTLSIIAQLGAVFLTIWLMVVCVDIYRQMQALKATHA